MPTDAVTALAGTERAHALDEYVELHAMSTVLCVLVGNFYVPSAGSSPFKSEPYESPWAGRIVIATEPDTAEVSKLMSELWPDDDDLTSAEYLEATRRADLLAASLLASIAANPEYVLRSAAWLVDGATDAQGGVA